MNYFVFGAGLLFFMGAIQSLAQGQTKLMIINFCLGVCNCTLSLLK